VKGFEEWMEVVREYSPGKVEKIYIDIETSCQVISDFASKLGNLPKEMILLREARCTQPHSPLKGYTSEIRQRGGDVYKDR